MNHPVLPDIEIESHAVASRIAPALAPLCRLLLVGASATRTARIRQLLASIGPQVCCEETPRPWNVPRRVQGGRYHLVLLDLEDTESTLRVCARLLEAAPDVPVLVLSAEATPDLARRVVALGAEDLLAHDELIPERLGRAITCALERHRRVVELRELSLTDPLTGLYNRRGFAVLAEAHRRVLKRTDGHSLLLFADVDGLKHINDRHGHAAGDKAIMASGMLLAGVLRASDIVARYGGDEFVALAHDASAGSAEMLVQRVSESLAQLHSERSVPFALSLSIGVASFGPNGGLDEALERADRALHREKRRRRIARKEASC